jgi:hypothetical protein
VSDEDVGTVERPTHKRVIVFLSKTVFERKLYYLFLMEVAGVSKPIYGNGLVLADGRETVTRVAPDDHVEALVD